VSTDPAGPAPRLIRRSARSSVERQGGGVDLPELLAVILISITAILTAWTGFQASRWGGAASISFSEASLARVDASRGEGVANRVQTIQVGLFTQWLQAEAAGDQRVMDYLAARFPEPLQTAFVAWQATQPSTNVHAPSSPFVMPEYDIPELSAAKAADHRADMKFAEALRNNQRGDNYTFLAVAFASVLFFAAMSGRMKSRRSQWTLLGISLAAFAGAVFLLLLFPKRI